MINLQLSYVVGGEMEGVEEEDVVVEEQVNNQVEVVDRDNAGQRQIVQIMLPFVAR